MSLKREMMDEIRDVQKLWSSFTIVLGIAIILTAWLPTDLSAGSKGPAFGNAGATGNSGINKSPQEPIKVRSGPTDPHKVLIPSDPHKVRSIPGDPHKVLIPSEPAKVRNTPTDPSGSAANDRGIIIVSGKEGKDASTTLDAKKIQQGIKINPGGPVELNPQPLPPKAFRRSIKINPGDAVGLNPQPLPPK